MSIDVKRNLLKQELERNNGILKLLPCWVARTLLPPGKRLKLDCRDLYIRGAERGAICERWLSSTGMADNGVLTVENEGLSFISIGNGEEKILLKEAIEILGDQIIGKEAMGKYKGLIVFAKFYDFSRPLPLHIHLKDKEASIVGVPPKPEAYYFPVQLNAIDYNHAYTYFGLLPGTTKEDLKKCLKNWGEYGDNGILELSKAYKLRIGTGWDIPSGILHAPGSFVTYEPQRVSDTSLFFQSMVHDKYIERDLLVKFVPEDKCYDYDYLADLLDWEANLDIDFKKNHYHEPVMVQNEESMKAEGYIEKWIAYGSKEFSAKELTVLPGKTVKIYDDSSYGLIMMEGYGTMNGVKIEAPSIIRYGEITFDEMFVSKKAAMQGVTITNLSEHSSIVMLKNFGPDNKAVLGFIK